MQQEMYKQFESQLRDIKAQMRTNLKIAMDRMDRMASQHDELQKQICENLEHQRRDKQLAEQRAEQQDHRIKIIQE